MSPPMGFQWFSCLIGELGVLSQVVLHLVFFFSCSKLNTQHFNGLVFCRVQFLQFKENLAALSLSVENPSSKHRKTCPSLLAKAESWCHWDWHQLQLFFQPLTFTTDLPISADGDVTNHWTITCPKSVTNQQKTKHQHYCQNFNNRRISYGKSYVFSYGSWKKRQTTCLVGGAITILKNMKSSELWVSDDIPYMKNGQIHPFTFETTNQPSINHPLTNHSPSINHPLNHPFTNH